MEQKRERVRLDEVTLMRIILALLIVFMHSFTCYQGGWEHPEGYVDIPLYKWIAQITFAFTLEAFVFISGYLFAFQRITLNKTDGLISLTTNKLKRLILPSIVFSLLYFPIFFEYKGIGDFLFCIVNGCGHMWFLPMLFWCFIGGWLLEQVRINDGWKMVFLACLNLFLFITLPLQITKAASYLFYFYGGYVVYKHSERIKKTVRFKHVVIGWILFIILFVSLRPLKDTFVVEGQDVIINKIFSVSGRLLCQLLYASSGTIAFYLTAVFITEHQCLRPFSIKFASFCFGIYLFQQFILKAIYYKTSFAIAVGPYWLPWLGFVIALLLSYLLTVLLLKTKVGSSLIG